MKRSWMVPVLGYPAFFLACFIGSLYLTFPMGLLKGRILEEMTRALNQGKNPGPYGKPGRVTADEVDLWRLSGVQFKRLTVYPMTNNPDPPIPYEFDTVNVRVQLLPLLTKEAHVSFHVEGYDGQADGEVIIAGEKFNEVKKVKATAEGFAWGKLGVVQEKMKVPAEGTLGGDVDLALGKETKDWNGTVKLKGDALAIGPGEIAFPGFGTLTLPHIDLGKLDGDIKVVEGKTEGPPITLNGKDIQGQLEAPTTLKAMVEYSNVNKGVMTFKLAEEFLKANPKFQTVVDFAPPLKSAKDNEGVFHFRLNGPIRSLDVRPDKNARIKGK